MFNDIKRLTPGQNDVDNILAWKMDTEHTVILTKKQQALLERIDEADRLMKQHQRRSIVVPLLMKKFTISSSVAYKAIYDMQYIYGLSNPINRTYLRHMAADMALKGYALAEAEKDVSGMLKAINQFAKAYGLDKEDDQPLPTNVFERHIVIVTTDVTTLGITAMSADERQAAISKYLTNTSIEIPYEDVTNPQP